MLKYILFLLIFIKVPSLTAGQTSPFHSYKDHFGFGKFLFFDEDYLRAISEFRKALYYHDLADVENSDSINYLIGISYSKIKEYDLSNQYLAKISRRHASLFERSVIEAGKNLLNSNETELAIYHLKNISPNNLSDNFLRKQSILLSSSYLLANDPASASAILSAAELEHIKLNSLLHDLENFKAKSPVLAGVLSGVVPGTGRFYTGDITEGLTSMFTIGLFGYRTFLEYRQNGINSWGFWAFGLATFYFYSGNVYGSVVSARLYNRNFYNGLRNHILDFINEMD